MTQEHYRKLENMYLNTKINTTIFDTTQATISEAAAEISLEITDKYFHALGAMHGSVYFKLLDDAAFFAVNSVVEDIFVLTSSFNVSLIRPVSKGRVTSRGKLRFQSKNLFIAEARLFNEEGQEIAFGTGHFAKSKIPLTEEIGYKL